MREVSSNALLCFPARVSCLANNPTAPIPMLTLFLLFFREPIGKKRSGKDSFPLCQFHQLLLSTPSRGLLEWGESLAPWRANPQGVELLDTACPPPSTRGFTAASKSLSHTPLCLPWCSQRWDRRPQLSTLRWPPCSLDNRVVATVAATPPFVSLPASCLVSRRFVPPSGFIQRTASFLQRGSNSRSLPGPCSRFAFCRGDTCSGWVGKALARSCHVPCSFLWWLVDTGQ